MMTDRDPSAAGTDNQPPMLEEDDFESSTAKEIWDSLELLMKGSGKTLKRRKEDMSDEYERFRANGNESIQAYFIRFHKLVND
nr:hypothetical protein [Tanacetum cinerariifolium]